MVDFEIFQKGGECLSAYDLRRQTEAICTYSIRCKPLPAPPPSRSSPVCIAYLRQSIGIARKSQRRVVVRHVMMEVTHKYVYTWYFAYYSGLDSKIR